MSPKVTIYHNPRCSKSRQTLELIRNRGIEPAVVEYLRTPLSSEQVRGLIEMLGLKAHDIVRAEAEALGLDCKVDGAGNLTMTLAGAAPN